MFFYWSTKVIGPGDSKYFANVCTALGWQQVAPPRSLS